ncbi:MAG TPA: cob(I)yrinic acid a,c-diamide adenosyltransferase, partial [Candidatus Goldiibacteriota bacterium]|nr:cob(I)yrinic acid a,c-diamide adenosyltransferase [Candidatus Goldiibacteriota bacterium]
MRNKGIVQLYTGNGKGKTTAAIGQAVRAAGAGMKVAFFQFLKEGVFPQSEEKMMKKCGIKVVRFREKSPLFDKAVDMKKLRASVRADWEKVKTAIRSGKYGMIVLDEVTHLVSLKLLDKKELCAAVNMTGAGCHFILTGRDAAKSIVRTADLVTEMKQIKHPYSRGVKAQRGI